jgi:hypothetical protein
MMKISEKDLAATVIRTEIERLKEAEERDSEADLEERAIRDVDSDDGPVPQDSGFKRVVFGSRLLSLSIEALEVDRLDDPAFQNFRSKLGSALTRLLGRANNNRVTLPPSHTVINYVQKDSC